MLTVSAADLALYAVALGILFLTPGPVWLALMARTVSGGFASAWPLALGVAVGDTVWPLVAILGLNWVTSVFDNAMLVLRWGACGFFLWLGWTTIRNAGREISKDTRLTRPGRMAGFLAGVAVILSNPKAILFYMGVLPGFFDLSGVTQYDILVICILSLAVPLLGNLVFAWFIDLVRGLIGSPTALRRLNVTAGILLILVGAILPFT
jgi:threonine/homoserine/homoserine lactone efflux protein